MICIGLCTCRNPKGLEKTLASLVTHQTKYEFRVLVIDNDKGTAGRVIAEAFSRDLDITYHVELTPGIPFARNALIEAAKARPFEYLIMIDDDEQPLDGWLDKMVDAARASGAAIVGGAVVPRFERAPELPVENADFEKRSCAKIGGEEVIFSTANILISNDFLEKWTSTLFDSRFQFSGGSDQELMTRIHASGFKHVFVKDALVIEDIPENRSTESWLLKRHERVGNGQVRIRRLHRGVFAAFARYLPHAAALWARGAFRALLGRPNLRSVYLGRKDKARAIGMFKALLGDAAKEYQSVTYRADESA